MNISEVHKETINEYIDNKLKDRHLLKPDIDSYTAFRIKSLAEDMFYAGYKDALETEKLNNKTIYNIDKLELPSDTISDEIIRAFRDLSKNTQKEWIFKYS